MTTQSTMIGPPYVRTMAAYNGAMNARVYAAASRLTDEQRRSAEGAFWGSIHGTLCHLLWADMMWMSRFAGWPKPGATLKESGELVATFEELAVKRQEADEGISAWAATVEDQWLAQNQSWFSGAAQRTVEAPRSMLVMHMFNHQTHHRGQVHALLTRAGQDTGDTDLFLVVPAAPL
jgi:uncharacterized damage-inducible protein DinB